MESVCPTKQCSSILGDFHEHFRGDTIARPPLPRHTPRLPRAHPGHPPTAIRSAGDAGTPLASTLCSVGPHGARHRLWTRATIPRKRSPTAEAALGRAKYRIPVTISLPHWPTRWPTRLPLMTGPGTSHWASKDGCARLLFGSGAQDAATSHAWLPVGHLYRRTAHPLAAMAARVGAIASAALAIPSAAQMIEDEPRSQQRDGQRRPQHLPSPQRELSSGMPVSLPRTEEWRAPRRHIAFDQPSILQG